MKRILYLFLLLLPGITGFAQTEALFEEGNAAYAEGNYEDAIEKYRRILAQGETAPAVHYNLANAHYKLNHVASSIYHYEKALQLAPGDEDIQNNLAFAQNMAIDAIEEAPRTGFSAMFEERTKVFDVAEWAWIGIFGMLMFVGLFLGYYFSRRPVAKRILFIAGIFFLLVAISAVSIAYMKENIREDRDFAIVFAEETEVRSEPDQRSSEVFTLHEGAKVRVMEEFQGWAKIRLPNGSQGWIEQTDIERL